MAVTEILNSNTESHGKITEITQNNKLKSNTFLCGYYYIIILLIYIYMYIEAIQCKLSLYLKKAGLACRNIVHH